MPRIRSLKPQFCASEAIAALSIPCRLHFAMLWTYADDHGRGLDNPRLIKGQVWPLDDDVTLTQVEAWQCELAENGRIVRYEHEGKALFEVVNFSEHQKPQHPAKSNFVSPHEAYASPTGSLREPSGGPSLGVVGESRGEVEDDPGDESSVDNPVETREEAEMRVKAQAANPRVLRATVFGDPKQRVEPIVKDRFKKPPRGVA